MMGERTNFVIRHVNATLAFFYKENYLGSFSWYDLHTRELTLFIRFSRRISCDEMEKGLLEAKRVVSENKSDIVVLLDWENI